MKFRIGSIIGWICAALVGALNIFAGVMKFVPVPADSPQAAMMQSMGMTPGLEHILGVIELVSVVLFLIPRTSTVGFVLITSYMAGALATLLTHGQDGTFLIIVLGLLTVSAYFRNPELLTRIKGKSVVA
jgi:hypothetical protein